MLFAVFQPELFLHIPRTVERIWNAKDRYYADDQLKPDMTMDDLEDLLQREHDQNPSARLPWSKATIDRARRKHPNLLPYWPMLKHHIRPWQAQPEQAPVLKADDLPSGGPSLYLPGFEGLFELVGVVVADHDGVLHLLKQVGRTVPGMAAGMAATVMLDVMSDGRLDATIHWCHILAAVLKVTLS